MVGPETSFKPGLGALEIACNAMEIAAKQTLCEDDKPRTGLGGYGNCMILWKHLARQASRHGDCHGCDGKWSKTDTWREASFKPGLGALEIAACKGEMAKVREDLHASTPIHT